MFAYCANNPVNKSDSTGYWYLLDDAIAACVGAVAGLAGQYISDVTTNILAGKSGLDALKPSSSWQTYVGAGFGGAVGGVASLYLGSVAEAAIASGLGTATGQTLENFTGGTKRRVGDIAVNTVVDTALGGFAGKVLNYPISGITGGRNNMAAVFQSGLTKIDNCTASRMSSKVFSKGIASSIVSGLGGSILNGFKSRATDVMGSGGGPLYWSPAK
jgi:hypothetical protein